MESAMMSHCSRRDGQSRTPTQELAALRQRFVALPDPETPTGWLVDLRDPFHPVITRYETWAEAQAAAEETIVRLLCTPRS
jgi:hypothetical protein